MEKAAKESAAVSGTEMANSTVAAQDDANTKEIECELRVEPNNSLKAAPMYGTMIDVNAATAQPAGKTAPARESEEAAANSPELKAILDDEAKQYPLWAWGLLMPMTGYTLGYSFIKNAIKNGDDCQPWSFWLWYVTPVPVLGGFMIATAWIRGRRPVVDRIAATPQPTTATRREATGRPRPGPSRRSTPIAPTGPRQNRP